MYAIPEEFDHSLYTRQCIHALAIGKGNRRMTQTFTCQAIVLIVEHRECNNCKSITKSPSCVMLALASPLGNKREWTAVPANFLEFDLPRETKHVQTFVEACESCFTVKQGDSRQLNLFNGHAKETYAMQNVEVSTILGNIQIKRLVPVRNIKEIPGTGVIGGNQSGKKPKPKLTDFF